MKVHVRPGTPLSDVNRRQLGRGFWLPSPTVLTVSNISPTSSATPHTLGPWTQIIAATTKAIHLLLIDFQVASSSSATNSSTLLSLSTGTAGSEPAGVVIGNLGVGYQANRAKYLIPVSIPVGSRLSCAIQGFEASKNITFNVAAWTLPFGRIPPSKLITIGADTATSRGIALAPDASANVKGAWVELTASVTQPLSALVIGMQGNGDTTIGADKHFIDIGIGAAGSEVVVIPDIQYVGSTAENYAQVGHVNLFPVDIPLGTRIAGRFAQDNVASNGTDITLLGVPRQ